MVVAPTLGTQAELTEREILLAGQTPTGSALSAALDDAKRAWRRDLEKRPLFHSLLSDPNFARALNFVAKAAARKRPGRYGDEFADARLMHVAVVAHMSRTFDSSRGPRHATRAQLDSALQATERVLRLLESGMRFGPFIAPAPLQSQLADFAAQLAIARKVASRNKPRAERETFLVDGIVHMLFRRFGEASPTLVQHIAAMLDIQFEHRSIERRIALVRKRNNVKDLALRAYRHPDRKSVKSPNSRRGA